MPRKRLIVHLGYHKTGSSSIQQWLQDHVSELKPHLACYNLVDGSANPLKFAAHALSMGRIGPEEFRQRAEEWAAEFRTLPQPVICITDEGLPGLPLGSLTQDYRETGIYPKAPLIVRLMAEAFAEFDPVFVVFEREAEPWLKSVHNQMFKQGCVAEDYWSFIDHYKPEVDWPAFRAELAAAVEAGSKGRGSLVACGFEEEFAKSAVRDMTFFRLLDIPEALMARCRPQLAHINPSVPLVAPPPARLPALVLGGANSMQQGGWVNLLRRYFTQLVEIRNLSSGAGTTAMGLYRFLSTPDRAPGAAVFWEYGVSEYHHLNGGQPLDSLLYHVEWLIQLCIRENRPLIPVLMCNRTQVGRADDPYVPALRRLFASYGVPILDVPMLLTVLARGEYRPDEWYKNNVLYKTDTPLPERVAEYAMMMHRQGRPPVQRPERAAHFDPLDLSLKVPENAPASVFEKFSPPISFVPFGDGPEIALSGRALAAMIVTSGSGPAIEVDPGTGDSPPPLSTQIQSGPGVPERQFRQIVLGNDPQGLAVEGALTIRPVAGDTQPRVQTMFVWEPAAAPDQRADNGLAAVLCEIPRNRD
ncbi:hypothetical protein M4578_23890 [Salipiger sp. P9]|uniref:SGNH/GDSL hydrolase family protein n=1 Tax=Salipiger pentaromativorans TaxID=2943193 RepID=UPI0021589393|nr:hypothetical protein [Salipiger pentaromativorans]MCR8550879.1 hypothetical protein [Salipiger pentaromativorans]